MNSQTPDSSRWHAQEMARRGDPAADPMDLRVAQALRSAPDVQLPEDFASQVAAKNSGERKEKTEWHRVVVFSEPLCKVIEQYVKKGSKLYIEGALQTRKWTDQSGAEKYSTEVVLQGFNSELVLLDGPSSQNREDLNVDGGFGSGGDSGRGTEKTAQRSNVGQQSASKSRGFDKALDDEIPF